MVHHLSHAGATDQRRSPICGIGANGCQAARAAQTAVARLQKQLRLADVRTANAACAKRVADGVGGVGEATG